MKPKPNADRHAYIPPSVEKAMSAKLPAHLQQYVGDNRPSYVPQHVQNQLNKQMERMPSHLKQYSGAFMEQKVRMPNYTPSQPTQPKRVATDLPSRPPIPNPLRLDQSLVVGEQPTATINTMAQNQNLNQSAAGGYDFLLDTGNQKNSPLSFLTSGTSMAKKLLILGGLGVVLIILVIVFSSLFLGGNSSSKALIGLAQQQNELIRVANEATNDAVNQSTKNLAINTALTLTTDQNQITTFLSQKHTKVSSKQLSQTQSSATDQQLKQAITTSTFDTVYVQITQNGLSSYLQSLQQTYKNAKDNVERQILLNEIANAKILLGEASSTQQSLQGS